MERMEIQRGGLSMWYKVEFTKVEFTKQYTPTDAPLKYAFIIMLPSTKSVNEIEKWVFDNWATGVSILTITNIKKISPISIVPNEEKTNTRNSWYELRYEDNNGSVVLCTADSLLEAMHCVQKQYSKSTLFNKDEEYHLHFTSVKKLELDDIITLKD